jgi:hypothetical protein
MSKGEYIKRLGEQFKGWTAKIGTLRQRLTKSFLRQK